MEDIEVRSRTATGPGKAGKSKGKDSKQGVKLGAAIGLLVVAGLLLAYFNGWIGSGGGRGSETIPTAEEDEQLWNDTQQEIERYEGPARLRQTPSGA